jgi:hypothetical protein
MKMVGDIKQILKDAHKSPYLVPEKAGAQENQKTGLLLSRLAVKAFMVRQAQQNGACTLGYNFTVLPWRGDGGATKA